MSLGPFAIPGSYIGDCRDLLARLPDESIHCCVTSPPYLGLRNYGIDPVVWGGNPDCGHEWGEVVSKKGFNHGGESTSTLNCSRGGRAKAIDRQSTPGADHCFCRKCGAWLGCLGLEPTIEMYVSNIVEVFRHVWRVLRKDGNIWINLGDSYSSGGRGSSRGHRQKMGIGTAKAQALGRKTPPPGLKHKDMCGIPWRVAFALQDDGWILRSDIIWNKVNPMPEPVTDRPTKSHEYIFLMTKSSKYFFDHEAVREPQTGNAHARGNGMTPKTVPDGQGIKANESFHAGTAKWHESPDGKRNLRSVWTIPTGQYKETHFATFPEEIPKRCIMAGTKPGDIVLDPFFGSGTVGQVAESLGRSWLGFDANPEYKEMQDKRTAQTGLKLGR